MSNGLQGENDLDPPTAVHIYVIYFFVQLNEIFTWTYTLQTNKAAFNQTAMNTVCKLLKLNSTSCLSALFYQQEEIQFQTRNCFHFPEID